MDDLLKKGMYNMRELIGECVACGKNVYCENGFFDGVHEGGKLYCIRCGHDVKEKEDRENYS
ncbi:hypothetical protein [Caldifermentibacillus hisashii]|uniref:hypothetical protein n=2 Tax=Caldifermentibacillus hisashii TaxID=996558 RepID=UPI0022B952C0|nr:hypothetical protein [Caldifermentibacillus hisashii]